MPYAFDFLSHWMEPAHADAAPAANPGNPERLISKLTAARTLRQLRAKAGLSQEQLAAKLELLVPDVIAIEIGEADCLRTLQVAERARRLLGEH
jgi:ribosome-binding protein aMBF1 (putative translation factor)